MSPKRKHDESFATTTPEDEHDNNNNAMKNAVVVTPSHHPCKKQQTPFRQFMTRLEEFRKPYKCAILVQGLPRLASDSSSSTDGSSSSGNNSGSSSSPNPCYYDSDDEDDDDNDYLELKTDEETQQVTQDQIDQIRLVMVTQERWAQIFDIRQGLLGNQNHNDHPTSTEFLDASCFGGPAVHHYYYQTFKRRFNGTREWHQKFDLLFCLTWNLQEFDRWMVDNQGSENGSDSSSEQQQQHALRLHQLVKDLAASWKRVLRKTNQELRIDADFTRPGIAAFLKKFKLNVENSYSEPPYRFRFE